VAELSALDLIPEAAVLVDEGGMVHHVNDRARAVLGLGPGAVGEALTAVLELRDASGQLWDPTPRRCRVGDRIPERVVHAELRGTRRPLAVTGRWSPLVLVLTFRSAGRREQLDAVRGDVVATVSHEIRSPLTSVKGFTRTMLAKWDRFSDEQKRAMLETIDADADRVTRLLGELLDVSRIDAGRVQLHRRPLHVGDVVASVVDKARHRDLGQDRDLRVEIDDEVPQVHADADKLEQVLTNLVENALRYAPEGVIRLEVRRETLEDGSEEVRVTVADEGPGIPSEQQALVFQKFGRAPENRQMGTGLGLYITRGLVEAHGGRVWIDPDDVDGATFHVSLPPLP
jgi:signal transduction histidine kinase